MKYKGILLDIDDTVYDYERSHTIALSRTFERIARELPLDVKTLEELYSRARQETHKDLSGTASSHNKLLYFQKMNEALNLNPLKYTLYFYNLYWGEFVSNIEPYEGLYDFLGSIGNRKICFFSDLTAREQHIKIVKLRLFDYSCCLVTSEEAGREKPDPSIFKLGLKKLCLDPDEVCVIGDSYERDIAGAVGLGIKAYWFNKKEAAIPQGGPVTGFRDFKELKKIFL